MGGQQWGALAADRKAAYQAQHEKAKENYQKVLEQYKKSDNYAAYQEKVAAKKKQRRPTKRKSSRERNKCICFPPLLHIRLSRPGSRLDAECPEPFWCLFI